REPLDLDGSRESAFAEPGPEGLVEQKSDVLAAKIAGSGHVSERLAVVAVQGEGDPHDVSVPAGDVESVGAPTLVGDGHLDFPSMRPIETMSLLPRKHQAGDPHDTPDSLAVVRRLPAGLPLTIDEPVRAPVAVRSPRLGHGEDLVEDLGVLGTPIEAALPRPRPKVTRRPCHVQRPTDRRHGSVRHRPDPLSKCGLFFTTSRAASRISMVMAWLPTRLCNSLSCCLSSRTLRARP